MSGRMVAVGFGNYVMLSRILAVVSPESAPIKRMIQEARETGRLVDATFGRRTRAVVICDSGQVVLSGLMPETIAGRMADKQ
nr:DUF370 domain-containing protein [bacterium]